MSLHTFQIEEMKGLMEEMDIDSMEVELEVEVEVDDDECIGYSDDEEYVSARYVHALFLRSHALRNGCRSSSSYGSREYVGGMLIVCIPPFRSSDSPDYPLVDDDEEETDTSLLCYHGSGARGALSLSSSASSSASVSDSESYSDDDSRGSSDESSINICEKVDMEQPEMARRRKGVTFSEDVQIVYIEACNEGRKVWVLFTNLPMGSSVDHIYVVALCYVDKGMLCGIIEVLHPLLRYPWLRLQCTGC